MKKNNICEWDKKCEEVAYSYKHPNGDTYHSCPLHWFISLVEELDSEVRDCLPVNVKFTKREEQIKEEIRELVRNYLASASSNYQLHKKIEKKVKKQ